MLLLKIGAAFLITRDFNASNNQRSIERTNERKKSIITSWHSRKRGNWYSNLPPRSNKKQYKKVLNTAENALEQNMIKNFVCVSVLVCIHFVHDKNQHGDNKRSLNGAKSYQMYCRKNENRKETKRKEIVIHKSKYGYRQWEWTWNPNI